MIRISDRKHCTNDTQKIGAAQKIAPGKVDLALSLVGYDDEVTTAMEYVFGSTLVCADATTAQRVTFDPAVRLKSVTLEGDVYDPAGTLSGGSAPQTSGVLVTLQKLNEVSRELDRTVKTLSELQATMAREKKRSESARKLKQELDLKQHEISLTEEQINGNSASSVSLARLVKAIVVTDPCLDHQFRRANEARDRPAERRSFEC